MDRADVCDICRRPLNGYTVMGPDDTMCRRCHRTCASFAEFTDYTGLEPLQGLIVSERVYRFAIEELRRVFAGSREDEDDSGSVD